jgi:hypothetical protein
MRLFAVHDSEGRISEVVMSPAEAPAPVLETTPGLTFTEIEPPEGLTIGEENLRDFAKTHRVAATTQRQKSSVLRLDAPIAD